MELWDGCDREISSLLRPSTIPLLPRCFLQSAVLKLGGSRARILAYGRQDFTTRNQEHDRRP
jgi:hypothetical protein